MVCPVDAKMGSFENHPRWGAVFLSYRLSPCAGPASTEPRLAFTSIRQV